MVRGPQARILSRLAEFPKNLEKAWDVPREICLPGLAEYLGVVRSALHTPINELLDGDYITERKAHVIGGGSRKRKVYHITDKGREISSKSPKNKTKKVGELFGNVPEKSEIIGREEFIQNQMNHEKMILTGLPGIGKTSLLYEISKRYVANGKTVRYAAMESFKDITDIFSDWGFDFTDEAAVLNYSKNDVLIIDEFQETNPRHLSRLSQFCKKAKNLIIASRPPLSLIDGFEIIEVPPLELESAIMLLPEEIENKEAIANRLGCHPLALQMHDISSSLPEEGDDLQSWVEEVILQDLGSEINAVNELSLLPIPVKAENLRSEEHIPELDDYALLRWLEHGVELHHLIRNVKATSMSENDYRDAADYWSNIDGDTARLVEMYLRLHSGQNIEPFLLSNSESLMARSSSGLASLISDALLRYPSSKLNRIAAIVAIERGEAEIANEYLLEINAPDLQRSVDLMMGKNPSLDTKDEDVRMLLSESSRLVDDRLPGGKVSSDVLSILEKINIKDLDENQRKFVLVAIAKIKHAYFLSENMWKEASEIRDQLVAISHENDPQILRLKMSSEIAETPTNSPSFDKLVENVFAMDGVKGKMLQASLIARCDSERAQNLLKKLGLPGVEEQKNLNSARRLAASIWYLRSKNKTHNAYSSMAEAISLWRKSLCPNASKSASDLLHKML
ncbi:MAG: hypothetical protein CMA91_01585 [Euryarchaeota archaeon]|nr:hypothetical protein [Euryarchaeota archaeon]